MVPTPNPLISLWTANEHGADHFRLFVVNRENSFESSVGPKLVVTKRCSFDCNLPNKGCRERHLLQDLVPIAQANYPRLLRHDSFVDCSHVIQEYEFDELVAAIAVDPGQRVKGPITGADGRQIIAVINASLQIEGGLRKIIVNSLATEGYAD